MKIAFKLIILASLGLIVIAVSCDAEKKQKDDVMKHVNYTYTILNKAVNSEELDVDVPLGFKLNSTENEYIANLNKLTKSKSNEKIRSIVSDYFGWKQKVRISKSHYFSDPNTQTDTLSSVSFIFDELSHKENSKLTAFRDSISKKFDDTWQVCEYQLDIEKPEELSNYHKYWIKNNIVVELQISHFHVQLTYYNAPKSYEFERKHFYDEISRYYSICEEVKKEINEIDNKPKIQNSPWDGSVSEVKDYLNKTLKDPDSYEGIEWSNVVKKDGYFFVRHKYRAKNSFGGYVIEDCIFKIDDKGSVINVQKR